MLARQEFLDLAQIHLVLYEYQLLLLGNQSVLRVLDRCRVDVLAPFSVLVKSQIRLQKWVKHLTL